MLSCATISSSLISLFSLWVLSRFATVAACSDRAALESASNFWCFCWCSHARDRLVQPPQKPATTKAATRKAVKTTTTRQRCRCEVTWVWKRSKVSLKHHMTFEPHTSAYKCVRPCMCLCAIYCCEYAGVCVIFCVSERVYVSCCIRPYAGVREHVCVYMSLCVFIWACVCLYEHVRVCVCEIVVCLHKFVELKSP